MKKAKISSLKISNALGIKEIELQPGDITEITGKKGAGKTSLIDALHKAFTNKNNRARFIKDGEDTAELYVELTNGITIDRSESLTRTNKFKLQQYGENISSPQAYLNSLFSEEQFNPIKFVELPTKEQKKILLSLVEIDWTEDSFVDWFGHLPEKIDLSQHILDILDLLGGKKYDWYQDREEVNRKIRNTKAIINDILQEIPEKFDCNKWEKTSLADLHKKINDIKSNNNLIQQSKNTLNVADEKIEGVKNKYKLLEKEEKELLEFKQEKVKKRNGVRKEEIKIEIESLKSKIQKLENESLEINSKAIEEMETLKVLSDKAIEGLKEKEELEIKNIEKIKKEAIDNIEKIKEINTEELEQEAEYAEKMKTYIPEYKRSLEYNKQVKEMEEESNNYTEFIQIARNLPGELLKTANMPVEGLSLKDGEILINGLPIDNLSDGEKLELSIEVAKAKAGEIGVVFVDGFEKLDSESRESFIAKAKESGLQWFITRVADNEFEIKEY